MVHGQDHLMDAITVRELDVYKRQAMENLLSGKSLKN